MGCARGSVGCVLGSVGDQLAGPGDRVIDSSPSVLYSVCIYIYIYIYIYDGYILSLHSDVVEAAQIPLCAKKIQKTENLVRSRFYSSVLLITQLQHSEQSVIMADIPHLQHI
jgi:hypothetical protein